MRMNNTPAENEVDENTFAKEALQCEIGTKLKQAREENGLTSEYIIKELKFSQTFLMALESGNWENLPGEVYALGFLKQYATLLHIDVSAEIERIKSKSFEMKTPVVYRDIPISPHRKWTFVAITVFIILIIVLNFSASDNNTNENQKVGDLGIIDDKPLVTEFVDAYTDAQFEVEIPATPEETHVNEEVFIAKKTYSFYAATNDVWLQVSELDENLKPKLLREVLLKKGQSFSIIDTASKLVLTAGNARALEVLEGNEVLFAAGSLGEDNKVLKLFPINP